MFYFLVYYDKINVTLNMSYIQIICKMLKIDKRKEMEKLLVNTDYGIF